VSPCVLFFFLVKVGVWRIAEAVWRMREGDKGGRREKRERERERDETRRIESN